MYIKQSKSDDDDDDDEGPPTTLYTFLAKNDLKIAVKKYFKLLGHVYIQNIENSDQKIFFKPY